MSQNANSLPSMLPGLFGIPAQNGAVSGSVGQPSELLQVVGGEVIPFGDILGLLGSQSIQSPGGVTTNVTGKPSEATDQFAGALLLTGIGLQQLLTINPNGAAPPTQPTVGLSAALSSADSDLFSQTGQEAQPASPISSCDIQPQRLPSGLISASAVHGLLLNATTQLGEGAWEIVKSEVSNGLLKLELRSKTNPGELLRIALPIGALESDSSLSSLTRNPISASMKTADRIPLVTDRLGISKFEQLLSKVQLKEMIVEHQPTEAGSGQVPLVLKSAVQITLIGNANAKPILLTAVVSGDQVKSQAATVAAPIPAANIATGQVASYPVSTADAKAGQTLSGITSEPMFGDTLRSAHQGSIDNDETGFMNDDFFGFGPDRTLLTTRLSTDRIDQPAVRFTLPDNLSEAVKHGAKSITLKIDPEHLGPARLNLVMNENSLSARLTVESLPAKLAVQNSIDQLTDQLARAGIRLDSIEVSIQGGGAHNQFFHRQADWFRSQRQMARFTGEDIPLPVSMAPAASHLLASYVAAGGVNLYA